jgi:hypothetical protein
MTASEHAKEGSDLLAGTRGLPPVRFTHSPTRTCNRLQAMIRIPLSFPGATVPQLAPSGRDAQTALSGNWGFSFVCRWRQAPWPWFDLDASQ